MIVQHEFRCQGRCPVDGTTDYYSVRVVFSGGKTRKYPLVEAIRKAAAQLLAEPILQEAFTHRLATELRCDVETVCRHGEFITTCQSERPGPSAGFKVSADVRRKQSDGLKLFWKSIDGLTAAQREEYRFLRSKKRLSAAEALDLARTVKAP